MALLAELRRRKVFRVSALYAVVAWLLIQIADTIAPLMNLPEAAPRFVLFLLIILFPVALVLAWAYQVTPAGVVPDPGPGDGGQAAASAKGAGAPATETAGARAMFFGVVAVALSAGFALYFYDGSPAPGGPGAVDSSAASAAGSDAGERATGSRQEPGGGASAGQPVDPESIATAEKSIAVLPFTAFSASDEDRFFADGLSDTLLNKLAQLSDVRVLSRSASFQYRGDAVDIARVGAELNVATVLEGSVQRNGDDIRIIAQLIDTASGGHLWSGTFDRSGNDIFAIHDEISDAVVENLALTLTPDERDRLRNRGTESVEAYTRLQFIAESAQQQDFFNLSANEFRARQYFWIEEARRILEIDPDYAGVYRFIAGAYSALIFQGRDGTDNAETRYQQREGYAAAWRAVQLEPENPSGLRLLASLSRRDRNYVQAEALARMAYARAPSNPGVAVEMSLALVAQAKSPAEALRFVELEQALAPNSNNAYRRRIFALQGLGRHDEALATAQENYTQNPRSQLAAADVANQFEGLGRFPEAVATLIEMRTRTEDRVGPPIINTWSELSAALGLVDEVRKMSARLEGEENRVATSTELLALTGEVERANELIRGYMADAGSDAPELRVRIAANCRRLGDYACTVAELLRAYPHLDARDGRAPGIVDAADFPPAVRLVHALRQSGDRDTAARLLQAVSRWYDERADYSYFRRSYIPAELALLRGDEAAALEQIRARVMLDDDAFIAHSLGGFDSSIYDSVCDNPEFIELVAEYDRRRAAAAAAVRALIADANF